MRHWNLLLEADEALRRLERSVRASPHDTEAAKRYVRHLERTHTHGDEDHHHKLIAARELAGHYTPEEAELHRMGIASNKEYVHWRDLSRKADKAGDLYFKLRHKHGQSDEHPDVASAFKQWQASTKELRRHHPERGEFPAGEAFLGRARELHGAGVTVLNALHRHPGIDDRTHKLWLASHAVKLHRPAGSHGYRSGSRWDSHADDKGETWFENPDAAEAYRAALEHHYGYKTRIRQHHFFEGRFHRVQYKRHS